MKREYLFFKRKKLIGFEKKFSNHVMTFHYRFWFGNNFLNV
jgi:hypothetical protein